MAEPPSPDADRYRDRIDISDDDDDFEYEVEPVDEEVLAGERARARRDVAQAEAAIDVDAVYRELDARDDFDAAFEQLRARFSLRSMLIATTVIAVLLGLVGSGLFTGATFAGFICVSLLGLGSAHAWLNYKERKRREAVLARRDRQMRRARRLAENPDAIEDEEEEDDDEPTPEANPLAEVAKALTTLPRFSLVEMMLATTIAAFVLVLLQVAGSPAGAGAALGMVALIGFAMQAAELSVPRILVLAWWLALVGYCLLSIATIAIGA